VCVCVCEGEREGERVQTTIIASDLSNQRREGANVYVCEREKERERERGRKSTNP